MSANVGTIDRTLRITAGIAGLGLGIFFQSWWGVLGLVPVLQLGIAAPSEHALGRPEDRSGVDPRPIELAEEVAQLLDPAEMVVEIGPQLVGAPQQDDAPGREADQQAGEDGEEDMAPGAGLAHQSITSRTLRSRAVAA